MGPFVLKWYIKPKYKQVLRKWYKDTGRGGRELKDFHKYCTLRNGSKAEWLVWIYAIDVASNFVLASVSQGAPPVFLRKESGFEDKSNDNGNENENDSTQAQD